MQFLILMLTLLIQGDRYDDGHRPSAQSTAPVRFALDELDRVAIFHNREFRPKYKECQDLMNAYYDIVLEETGQYTKTVDQLSTLGRLRTCAKDLEKSNKDLNSRLKDFSSSVKDIPK